MRRWEESKGDKSKRGKSEVGWRFIVFEGKLRSQSPYLRSKEWSEDR